MKTPKPASGRRKTSTAPDFSKGEVILAEQAAAPSAQVDDDLRLPTEFRSSWMTETNGGGRLEAVPGHDAFLARNRGLPAFLDSDPDRGRPENTIGADDRLPIPDTTVVPWRSICRLVITYKTGQTATGTAFFIGPRALATAGHNIIHPDAGPVASMAIQPAFDGAAHFEAPAIESYVLPPEWRKGFAAKHDYGCILLKDGTIGHQLGWFGLARYDAPPHNLLAQVCGYPAERRPQTQYYHGGRLGAWSDDFIHYTFDTTPGMSGAPVFATFRDDRLVIGVHHWGSSLSNRGIRLSGDAYRMLSEAAAWGAA